MAFLYDRVVASAIGYLYDALAEFFFADLADGCRFLDLGCGSGQVSLRIARQNPQAQVVGIDLAAGQIARAKKRSQGMTNLTFEIGNAMNLHLPDNSFDIVLSVASIKHWPDMSQGIHEMTRVCKPEGHVWVIEVDTHCTDEEAENFVATWKLVPGTRPLIRRYFQNFVSNQGLNLKELEELLRKANLKDVYVQRIPDHPFIIGTGIKK